MILMALGSIVPPAHSVIAILDEVGNGYDKSMTAYEIAICLLLGVVLMFIAMFIVWKLYDLFTKQD